MSRVLAIVAGAVLCAVASGAAPPATPGFLVRPEAPRILQGATLRVHVDPRGTGSLDWCYYRSDGMKVENGVVDVRVYNACCVIEPIPCPDPTLVPESAAELVFDVPTDALGDGFHRVRVRELLAYGSEDPFVTVAETGVDVTAPRTSLALQSGAIVAWADFHDPFTGTVRHAQVYRVSEESGLFTFFSAGNPELALKVLDARAIDGRFWIFASSLTTVELDLHVMRLRDDCVDSGLEPPCPTLTFHQAAGQNRNFVDTAAFPDLP